MVILFTEERGGGNTNAADSHRPCRMDPTRTRVSRQLLDVKRLY